MPFLGILRVASGQLVPRFSSREAKEEAATGRNPVLCLVMGLLLWGFGV